MTTTPNEPVDDSDIETVGAPAGQSGMGLGDADADASDSSLDGAEGGDLDVSDETDADSSDSSDDSLDGAEGGDLDVSDVTSS